MRNSSRWIAVLSAMLIGATATPAAAQGLTLDQADRPTWWFGVGGFSGENAPGRLDSQRSRLAGYLGADHDPAPRWQLGGDILTDSQRYELQTPVAAPLFGTVDGSVDVAAVGLVGAARYPLPFAGLHWYGGGGAGLYRSRPSVSGSPFGLPGSYDETDTNFGVHAEAGLSLPVSAATEVGLSLRRLWLRSDVGSATGGSVDIGGRFIFLGLRYTR